MEKKTMFNETIDNNTYALRCSKSDAKSDSNSCEVNGGRINSPLYYFTRAEHLPTILKHGIPLSNVPVDSKGCFLSLVCLTENSDWEQQTLSRLTSGRFRLTVKSDVFRRWSEFAKQRGIAKRFYRNLGHEQNDKLWVSLRIVRPCEITDVSSMRVAPLSEDQIERLRNCEEVSGRDIFGIPYPTKEEQAALSEILGSRSPWEAVA